MSFTRRRAVAARFFDRAVRIGVSFAALCVELGGERSRLPNRPLRDLSDQSAFAAASALPDGPRSGCGASFFGERRRLIATNTIPTRSQRRFMLRSHRYEENGAMTWKLTIKKVLSTVGAVIAEATSDG